MVDFSFNNDKEAVASAAVTREKMDTVRSLMNEYGKNQPLGTDDSLMLNNLTRGIQDSAGMESVGKMLDMNRGIDKDTDFGGYVSREEYDSANAERTSLLYPVERAVAHKFFELKEKGAKKSDIVRNLYETAFHNLPKALFIYLPVFAFLLWIFHNKKKWWYFDHGVFTLHYFSFLLLAIVIISFLLKLANITQAITVLSLVLYLVVTAVLFYSLAYFFIAHRRVYHSGIFGNIVIGGSLFFLNALLFMVLLIILGIFSFLMIE